MLTVIHCRSQRLCAWLLFVFGRSAWLHCFEMNKKQKQKKSDSFVALLLECAGKIFFMCMYEFRCSFPTGCVQQGGVNDVFFATFPLNSYVRVCNTEGWCQ